MYNSPYTIMLTLTVEKRVPGNMPAVYYGPNRVSTSVSVPLSEFRKSGRKAGESSVIILKDGSTEHEALIQEVDRPH